MQQEETVKIVEPMKNYLEHKGWLVIKTHGNQFQKGLPDHYICHAKYAPRWVEYKIKGRSFTQAQKILFPKMILHNVPLYLIEGVDFRGMGGKAELHAAYNKLFEAPNLYLYLHYSNRKLGI